eukprot:jgi/Galph1/4441/GphlegSOOS_G3115.1
MPLRQSYLFLYNFVSALGWTYIISRVCKLAVIGYGVENTYSVIAQPIVLWQSLQALEIVHASLGIVRSSVLTTFIQIASRLVVLLAVIYRVPEVQRSIFFTTLTVAWSLAEVARYLYYAMAITSSPSKLLTWIRYSAFLILYPLGAGSEMLIIYNAMPFIKERRIWSISLPNKLNFAFDFYSLCWFLLFLYLPGLPYMYLHMMRQRRKYLSKLTSSNQPGSYSRKRN